MHPEVIQITPYFIKLECNPLFLKEFQVGIAVFDIGILIFFRNCNCDVFNIFPVIAILRQIKIQTQMLTVSRLQTLAEIYNLISGIINIIFTAHIISACFHQTGDAVTPRGTSCMTQMQITCRIRRNIFHIHLQTLSIVAVSVVVLLLQNPCYDLCKGCVLDREVDKAGSCNFTAFDICRRFIQCLYNSLCNFTRIIF